VNSQVKGVAQNHVAQGTNFNTDVFLDDLILQVREERQLEPMTDSLGAKEDGVMEVLAITVVSFTAVEEERHVSLTAVMVKLLSLQDLLSKT